MLTAREVASIFARWSTVPLPSSPMLFPAKSQRKVAHMSLATTGSCTRACRSPSPGPPGTSVSISMPVSDCASPSRGEQVADLLSFNRDDVRELSRMHSSRAVNFELEADRAAHIPTATGTRAMWRIEETSTGENYSAAA